MALTLVFSPNNGKYSFLGSPQCNWGKAGTFKQDFAGSQQQVHMAALHPGPRGLGPSQLLAGIHLARNIFVFTTQWHKPGHLSSSKSRSRKETQSKREIPSAYKTHLPRSSLLGTRWLASECSLSSHRSPHRSSWSGTQSIGTTAPPHSCLGARSYIARPTWMTYGLPTHAHACHSPSLVTPRF